MSAVYKVAFAISAALIPMLIKYWLKKRHKNKLEKLQIQTKELGNSYYHCIFWTLENFNCRQHIFDNSECGDKCSVTYLNTILKFLSSAKRSIALCMYHLTLRQVTDEIISAANRGVEVRIITDCVTSKMSHSKMKFLKEVHGFDVRTPQSEESYMHHKYCVIDAEDPELQKVFLGSFNLTLQACVANFEFMAITNNPAIVTSYSNEFNILWTSLGV